MKKITSVNLSRLRRAEFGHLIVHFFEDFSNSILNTGIDKDFKRLCDNMQSQTKYISFPEIISVKRNGNKKESITI